MGSPHDQPILFSFFFFLMVLGFELRTLCLLGRYSTTWDMSAALFCLFESGSHYSAGCPQTHFVIQAGLELNFSTALSQEPGFTLCHKKLLYILSPLFLNPWFISHPHYSTENRNYKASTSSTSQISLNFSFPLYPLSPFPSVRKWSALSLAQGHLFYVSSWPLPLPPFTSDLFHQ
jgi:hypothetical protein